LTDPVGNAFGVRTESLSVIAASALFSKANRVPPACFPSVSLRVEIALEAIQDVVGRSDARVGRDLGGPDRAGCPSDTGRPPAAPRICRDLFLQFSQEVLIAAPSVVFHSM